MNKSLFKEILKSGTHSPKNMEEHLLHSYLISNNLDFSENQIFLNYFSNFKKDIALYTAVNSLKISDIKELENYLELIIPSEDRKLNGAFFTPSYIVDFIINEIKPSEEDKNLDLSCGCGAFLIGLAQYYKYAFNKPIRKIIKENIYGSDILSYNIQRTKLILTIFGLENGETVVEDDFNLTHQDSLRADWAIKYDNIVGNPPYVKFQDLNAENRSYLIKNWETITTGTFNLYFAFFELGYKLLKPTGKLGYITPNNYFTSLAGIGLRRFFHKEKCITRIIDFNHRTVFDAQTYTAITFLNKQLNDYIKFDRLGGQKSPDSFLANANGSLNTLENLNPKKWRLLKKDEQENINIIESSGVPIGELFDICVGIATLKDDIFFVDGITNQKGNYIKATSKGVFEIEKEITRPVYKVSDFKSQEDIPLNTKRIIYPYRINKGKAIVISETEFKDKYPKCYLYLLSEKETLLARDKGKVVFDPFFAWGRTQGLTRTGKKIITPTFSQKPRFLIVDKEDSFFTNGYGIFFKEHSNKLFSETGNPLTKIQNIDVVQKILNSYLMHYYVGITSVSIEGGYPCYQKNFIEKFTIPNFNNEEMQTLRNLTEPEEIDAFLIEKYQLKLLSGNLV